MIKKTKQCLWTCDGKHTHFLLIYTNIKNLYEDTVKPYFSRISKLVHF